MNKDRWSVGCGVVLAPAGCWPAGAGTGVVKRAIISFLLGVVLGVFQSVHAGETLYPLYTDATNICQFSWWATTGVSNRQVQVQGGAYEGTHHWLLEYTITNWWQAAVLSLVSNVDASSYQYLRIAYQGPSTGLVAMCLMDAAAGWSEWVLLEPTATYTVTNLPLAAFEGGNFSALQGFIFGMRGVPSAEGVSFAFDDVRVVATDLPSEPGNARIASVAAADESCLLLRVEEGKVTFDDDASGATAYQSLVNDAALNHVVTYGKVSFPAAVATNSWRLYGPGAYSEGLSPTAVYRKSKVNGMAQFGWNGADYDYGYTLEHQFYLRLPQPLVQGGAYTLAIAPAASTNTSTTNFVYDVFQNRSESVKVNLVGYDTLTTNKAADLYLWMGNGGARDYSSFEGRKVYLYNPATGVSNEVGAVSFWKGAGVDVGGYPMLRSPVWKADIAGAVPVGAYRLVIQGVGCSEDFVIKPGVYREPFLVSTRGFFYMRVGAAGEGVTPVPRRPLYLPGRDPVGFTVVKTSMHPLRAEWANGGDRWDQPAFFANYAQPGSPVNTNAWGGHSDALDWDRHLGHISIIHDLLLPYLLSNGRIRDDDLGIPESGNGIPDVIDEARYEVDFWLRLRDGAGYSHGLSNPNDANTLIYQAGATPLAAWAAAANAALLAAAFRIAGRADEMSHYRDAAVAAYTYVNALADPGLTNTQEAGFTTFRGRDLKMMAAAFLYNLTGDTNYESVVNAESVATSDTSVIATYNTHNQHYASVAYLITTQAVHYAALRERMRASLLYQGKQEADQCLNRPSRRGTDNTAGYFHTIQNMHNAIIAHAVATNPVVRADLFAALTLEADWGLGRNPINLIQMTTASTPLAGKRSVMQAYTTGRNDGTPGLHPGHTPYMNMDNWYSGLVMGRPSALTALGYPGANLWPQGELFFDTRFVWAHAEFTPQQTMRGKQALYGYLYAIGGSNVSYAITYRANGATSGVIPASQSKAEDIPLILADNSGNLARIGYLFAGWNTATNGTGTDYAVGATYADDTALTLYAKWLALPTYPVTYAANGATSGIPPLSQVKTEGLPLVLATNSGGLARAGYSLAGWNTASNGTGLDYSVGATYTNDEPLSLFARWMSDYTVTYDANGATNGTAPASQVKTYGLPLTLATNSGNLARGGYTFVGWSTATNGLGADYGPGASYTVHAPATLYAKWVPTACITRVMPLGDSITGGYPTMNGNPAHASYRRPFWFLLQTNGYLAVDMVGYLNGPEGAPTDFDRDHVGFNTYVSGDVLGLMDNWILSNDLGDTPDIVLLCLGHNDMEHGLPDATVYTNLCTIIDKCQAKNPGVMVLLCKMPQSSAAAARIQSFNETYIPAIAAAKSNAAAPVLVVDLWTNLPWATYTFDGVHPNEAGEAEIAQRLYAAMRSTYTVTYQANGATSGTAPTSQPKGHNIRLNLADNSGGLSRPGCAFAGWNTATNGTGADYAVGGAYTNNASLTLYARWTVLDADGDGMTDANELVAGTDSQNAMSRLVMSVPESGPLSSGVVVVCWQSASNRHYTLQSTTNLTAGFVTWRTNIPATPVLNVYTDDMSGVLLRFYRVKVEE